MITNILNYVFLFTIVIYLIETLRFELMFFQQNSYRDERYLRSVKDNVVSKRNLMNIILLLLAVFSMFHPIAILAGILFATTVALIRFKEKYKKPVVYTARIKRLISVNILFSLIAAIIIFHFTNITGTIVILGWIILLYPIVMIICNAIISPIEKGITKHYYNDAKKILKSHNNLTIIGITGSFGKTSTKHYLYRILSEEYNVLMTPGNYNTTLGVVRTIREQLKPSHQVFIVEMGAKQIGDIKEICDLVNPSIGIITAVGEQHLETFKNILNIQKTKFELVDSLPENGMAVINGDYEYINNRDNSVSRVEDVKKYSMNNDPSKDFFVKDIFFDKGKSIFTVASKDGNEEQIATRLLGKYNISNLVACIIVAKKLNVSSRSIKNAINDIYPVEHRLSIKTTASKITIIDDAYNSNPIGSEMALEVLDQYPGNKKIIITPGMVEQGDKQFENNKLFGKNIAAHAGYAIIVGQYNRESISQGLKEGGFDMNNYFAANTLNDATNHLAKIAEPNDVVLYENDLPDTFK
ncbi:MAG: UDP-N-acetylmuramoyl-tripeptide--D-alanyl-D-alanine ligase [Bacteroidales bacterium]|nr:UDP-N-acetylmuramoyl-tripeptide--D-alanyl-D-alanine ligase [Bacteroidales bacterium]